MGERMTTGTEYSVFLNTLLPLYGAVHVQLLHTECILCGYRLGITVYGIIPSHSCTGKL